MHLLKFWMDLFGDGWILIGLTWPPAPAPLFEASISIALFSGFKERFKFKEGGNMESDIAKWANLIWKNIAQAQY